MLVVTELVVSGPLYNLLYITEPFEEMILCWFNAEPVVLSQPRLSVAYFTRGTKRTNAMMLSSTSCLCTVNSYTVGPVHLLPPANEVWGKVIYFSSMCQEFCSWGVCLSACWDTTHPPGSRHPCREQAPPPMSRQPPGSRHP